MYTRIGVKSKRIVIGLLLMLAGQLSPMLLFKLDQAQCKPNEAKVPLLPCDFSKVSKIVIEAPMGEGKAKSKIVILKDNFTWKIPNYYNFEASEARVNQLFGALKHLRAGTKVADTPDACQRYKVTPGNCQTAISLYDKDHNMATLHLGESPSFRNFYAKTANSNDIFIVEFLPEYMVATNPSDWIETMSLELKPTEVTSVDMGTFKVESSGGKWFLTDDHKTHPLDIEVAKSLIDAVSFVCINSVLGKKEDLRYGLDKPTLAYSVTLRNGTTIAYRFSKPRDKDFYILHRSDMPWYAGVNEWYLNRIRDVSADWLLQQEAEKETVKRRSKMQQRQTSKQK